MSSNSYTFCTRAGDLNAAPWDTVRGREVGVDAGPALSSGANAINGKGLVRMEVKVRK